MAHEELCTLEVIGEVGSGEELPELHRLTFWECESGPLAMPPALLSQLRTDVVAGFVTRRVFVFQYRFLKDRRQGCFSQQLS